ncbi:hypothetical protein ABVT39_000695 [Epinephelus coioides]
MLDINIDGVPLFKSNTKQFWFSIFGFGQDFVQELVDLQEKGIDHEGMQFQVKISAFICDSPARAFVKCIKGHNAYQACERCNASAIRVDSRMVYTDHATQERRTDEKFNTVEYRVHQKKASPLITAGVGCVSQFVLDYMHVVCLGVVKRLLIFLIQGPAQCKLPTSSRDELSTRSMALRGEMPSEFARIWIGGKPQNFGSSFSTRVQLC